LDGYEDLGPVVWGHSKLLEKWEVAYPPEPLVPMMLSTLLVDQTLSNATQPYVNALSIEPFGIKLASVNATYTDWSTAPPPPQAFAVQGLASCPMICDVESSRSSSSSSSSAIGSADSPSMDAEDIALARLAAATSRPSVFRRLAARLQRDLANTSASSSSSSSSSSSTSQAAPQ